MTPSSQVSSVAPAGPTTAQIVVSSGASAQAASTATPDDSASLLPEPSIGGLEGGGAGALDLLYFYESQGEQADAAVGTNRIASLQAERHEALQKEQQAIQQAMDAEKQHSFWDSLGGIFSEVGKVAAVVASIAAAVATAGAATPVAAIAIGGAVLSSASFVDGEFHVLQSLGVDASTAGWLDTGMAIGGSLASVGTAVGAAAAAGGRASTTATSLLSTVSSVVGGAGTIGSGLSRIEAGHAQAESDQAEADRVAAQARSDEAQRLMQAAVDDTQTSDEQSRRVLGTIAGTDAIRNQTAESAAAAVRG